MRDLLHPSDVAELVVRQLDATSRAGRPQIVNVSGGAESACSLAWLSDWCRQRFGDHEVGVDPEPRPYDLPWIVLDSRLAGRVWDWRPRRTREQILEEIADHAETHPDWLEMTGGL